MVVNSKSNKYYISAVEDFFTVQIYLILHTDLINILFIQMLYFYIQFFLLMNYYPVTGKYQRVLTHSSEFLMCCRAFATSPAREFLSGALGDPCKTITVKISKWKVQFLWRMYKTAVQPDLSDL